MRFHGICLLTRDVPALAALSVCDELLADDYLDHDAPPGTPPGPGATREYVAAHPVSHFAIEDLVVADDHVALRATWPDTVGLVLIRLDRSGRLAERWSVYRPR